MTPLDKAARERLRVEMREYPLSHQNVVHLLDTADALEELARPSWTPGNHCPWKTKHGLFVYEYCRLQRGHEDDHVMEYVDGLQDVYAAARELHEVLWKLTGTTPPLLVLDAEEVTALRRTRPPGSPAGSARENRTVTAVYLAGMLIALGWHAGRLHWQAIPAAPWLSTGLALGLVVLQAALWPVRLPVVALRRRGVLAILALAVAGCTYCECDPAGGVKEAGWYVAPCRSACERR